METNIKDLGNCKKEFEATISYEELIPQFENAIIKYRQKVQIPGFRKGKAPLSMVKKLYGDSIEYTSLEEITEELFKNYIEENKIRMIGKGVLKDMDYKPKESLLVKVEFEVIPEVVVENYKNLDLTRTKFIVDESLVDEELIYMNLKFAQYEIDGQAMDDEYMITFDTQEVDDTGNVIVGKTEKDIRIYLGSKHLEKDYKEGLKGIRENEERIIEVTNPANQEKKKLQIKCTKIEKIVKPEMNEETYKKFTGREDIKTEEEMRKVIKEEIQKAYDNVSNQRLKDSVLGEIIKANEILVPDFYVNLILDDFVKEHKHKHGKHDHMKEFNEEEFRQQQRPNAIFNTKWFLIKEKIVELEKIELIDEDYNKLAEDSAKRYNIPADKLIEVYKANEDIKSQLLADKVLDFIIKNSNVSEVEEIKKAEDIDV
jgi:trigger factor